MNKTTTKISLSQAVADYSSDGNSEKLIEYIQANKNGTTKTQYMCILLANMFKDECPFMKTTVANYYVNSKIMKPDYELAIRMYTDSSDNGEPQATFMLGFLAFNSEDYEKANDLLGRCIEKIEEYDFEIACEIYNRYATTFLKQENKDIGKAICYFEIAVNKYSSAYAAKMLFDLLSDQNNKDYYDKYKAYKYIIIAAECKDMYACTIVAEMFLDGDEELGVSKNVKNAYDLMINFADVDDFSVNYLLGRIYMSLPAEDDVYDLIEYSRKAKYQLEKAWQKKKTFHIAKMLSVVYDIITSEKEKALEVLLFLEKNGDTSCAVEIADLYLRLNYSERALYYFEKALAENIINEQCLMSAFSILAKPEYGSDGISRMCDLLDKYLNECEAKGEYKDINVACYVAEKVLESKATHKMPKQDATQYLEIAITKNHKKNYYSFVLGKYYQQTQNFRNAEKCYLDAFNCGNPDAGAYLAHLYEEGGGSITRNFDFALNWYCKAAEAGSSIAATEKERFVKVTKGLFKNKLVVERIEVTSYEY